MGCHAALEKTLPAELEHKEPLHPRHPKADLPMKRSVPALTLIALEGY
jgi:hypothetical protein